MPIASRFVGVLFAASMSLAVGAADGQTQSRTAFLIDRLRSDDVRVRTQAALALGGTSDEAAVQPLCGALSDDAELVRQASAAALKRLGRATAAECLKSRLAVERSQAVKLQIARALEALETGGADSSATTDDTPRLVPNAKFYVALSSITNNTGRPQAEIDKVVGAAIRQKLDALGDFQLAPMKETSDTARAVMTKRKLKGYFLSVSVDPLRYEDGSLRVRVKIAVFTYPGKDLRGEVPAGVGKSGVRPHDRASEDELLAMAAGRLAELFAQNFK